MPKHIQVSPDEDLATFYGGGGRTHIPDDMPGTPFALEIDDPESEEVDAAATPASPPSAPTPASRAAVPPLSTAPAAPPPPPTAAPPSPPPAPPSAPPRAAPPPTPPAPPAAPPSLAMAPPKTGRAYSGPSPIVAALLSFFFPGLGQILVGQTTKGVVLLLLAICTGCGLGIVNVVFALDAYAIAKRRTAGEPVDDWQFF